MHTFDHRNEPQGTPEAEAPALPDLHRHPLAALDSLAVMLRCRRRQQIHSAGDPAVHWYRVVSGLARRCAFFPDGRRQIVEFLFPDDLFGFSTGELHGFSVEAVLDGTVVARYPRQAAERLVSASPAAAEYVRQRALESLRRMESRLLSLGRMTARERVGTFLLEMAERVRVGASQTVPLRMSRYDIADYLALSGETVSRTLSELKQRGSIALPSTHEVHIADRSALAAELWTGAAAGGPHVRARRGPTPSP